MDNKVKSNFWQVIKQFERSNQIKLVWIIRFIIASLFILSAAAKLLPIEFFEKQLVSIAAKPGLLHDFTNWSSAQVWARIILITELFLGLSLLIPFYTRVFTAPLAISLLLVFIAHLGYQIALFGNSGNCGCMGELIPMSPLNAIFKNIITILLLIYLYATDKRNSNPNPVFHFLLLPAVSLWVFIFFPIKNNCFCQDEINKRVNQETLILNQRIDTLTEVINSRKQQTIGDSIVLPKPIKKTTVSEYHTFKDFEKNGKKLTIQIDEDKSIVCVFNPECEHCLAVAKQLKSISKLKNGPKIQFLFFNPDAEKPSDMLPQINKFMKDANVNFPFQIINMDSFNHLLVNAPAPPRVTLLDNGKILYDYLGEGEINIQKIKKLSITKL